MRSLVLEKMKETWALLNGSTTCMIFTLPAQSEPLALKPGSATVVSVSFTLLMPHSRRYEGQTDYSISCNDPRDKFCISIYKSTTLLQKTSQARHVLQQDSPRHQSNPLNARSSTRSTACLFAGAWVAVAEKTDRVRRRAQQLP